MSKACNRSFLLCICPLTCDDHEQSFKPRSKTVKGKSSQQSPPLTALFKMIIRDVTIYCCPFRRQQTFCSPKNSPTSIFPKISSLPQHLRLRNGMCTRKLRPTRLTRSGDCDFAYRQLLNLGDGGKYGANTNLPS